MYVRTPYVNDCSVGLVFLMVSNALSVIFSCHYLTHILHSLPPLLSLSCGVWFSRAFLEAIGLMSRIPGMESNLSSQQCIATRSFVQ